MNKITVIVIDDERPAREELKTALKPYPDFRLIGEAGNADEARDLINSLHPDLIFLDIHMPERSGFDLLETLDDVPTVIFITAFDQYAVKAFESNALDYLMKPIRDERFARAIAKVRISMENKNAIAKAKMNNRQIFIRDGDKYHFIRLEEIFLIESVENYSRLYFNGKKVLIKRSLRQWEEILDQSQFFRISRTQIINTHQIREIHSKPRGKLEISLKTGQQLDVSSRQSAKFRNLKSIVN